ncbi:maleylacetate reductase [Streptomyces sp. NPDC091219]|uniref:maleylacetate reductase n=1 Tax=Streptomyces sp. NPDC091219 TaxID=3155193 RepID=UPI00344E2299
MRVMMGAGVLNSLAHELDEVGLERVLVLCSPHQEDLGHAVARIIGERAVGVYPHAQMHVPVETATAARERARELGADGCVAVGGGSAIGLGKAIALEHELKIVAVPTTYAGSEMTPVWGLTESGRKRTGRDRRVLPASVLYDPELTLTLSPSLTSTSGMNAIAHAVEALYAPDTAPIINLMAQEGVQALAAALPAIVADGADILARAEAQYGAWLCGACLGATTMSLHHKLCHVLGGALDLPHADTHTVVLPHVLAYNLPSAPEARAALGQALYTREDPSVVLWELSRSLQTPQSLRDLGMKEESIDDIVEATLASPYANPREVTSDGLTGLLRRAWAGEAPVG